MREKEDVCNFCGAIEVKLEYVVSFVIGRNRGGGNFLYRVVCSGSVCCKQGLKVDEVCM